MIYIKVLNIGFIMLLSVIIYIFFYKVFINSGIKNYKEGNEYFIIFELLIYSKYSLS